MESQPDKTLGALGRTPVSRSLQDADLRYVWIDNQPASWGIDTIVGRTDLETLPAVPGTLCTEAKREAVASGEPAKIRLTVERPPEVRHFDLYVEPQREDGRITGLFCTTIDVTELRKSEATQRTLLRELSHRSKNLLAIVQSLASQTARTARTLDEFVERFNGRIQAVSRSQDLVTATDWRGARLGELVRTQVQPYAIDAPRQLAVDDGELYLSPNAALYVGLALHELAVNSVQSGALAAPAGRVTLATRDANGAAERGAIAIVWEEAGGPGMRSPDTSEFGHILLARLVPSAVGGTASLRVADGRLTYEVTLARSEYE